MIELFKEHPFLKKTNHLSLSDPKVEIIVADAFQWLKSSENQRKFDLIIAGSNLHNLEVVQLLDVPLRYLNQQTLKGMFSFSKDILPTDKPPVNKLNNQVLVNMYSKTYYRLVSVSFNYIRIFLKNNKFINFLNKII